jgi:hypothetical protein
VDALREAGWSAAAACLMIGLSRSGYDAAGRRALPGQPGRIPRMRRSWRGSARSPRLIPAGATDGCGPGSGTERASA